MKKNIIYRDESPNLKKVMEDFCKAKQAIYQYSPEEYEQKVKNFYENVQSIQFIQTTLLSAAIGQGGGFARKKGNIVLRTKESNFKGRHRLSSHDMQVLIHELNHAWNYEKNKRLGIISKPLTKSRIMKYIYIMEAINEAEAQLLCSEDLKRGEFFNPHRDSKYIPDENEFFGYGIEESSIFQMLCTVCNQSGSDFLKSIEGMTVEGIISHISTRTGCSIDDTTKYFDKFAELTLNARKEKGKITSKIAKAELKQNLKYVRMSKEEKEEFIENIDKDDTMVQTLSSIQAPSRISRNI